MKLVISFEIAVMTQIIDKDVQVYNINTERTSREQYNKDIQEAEQRMDAGHYLTQEDVEKDAATW